MKFIDLQCQYQREKQRIDQAIAGVLSHGQFVFGPEVAALEARLADWVGVSHCVTVSNGTVALQAALMALDIGPGDEVIVPAFGFFATASMVLLVGATPVFVDIHPETYNIDPALIEAAITDKTRAIIPVDLYGQPADYAPILAIAKRYGLSIIEDAAQAFGASYDGQQTGSFGDIATMSFYPAKPLGCYGEGGACFTNDDALAKRLRLIRHQGQDGAYHHVALGLNARLSTLQAAILLAKLDCFAEELAQRQRIAAAYDVALRDSVKTPTILGNCVSSYAQYTIQVNERETFRAQLQEAGIPTAVHYPKGIHQQPYMIERGLSGAFPVTESVASRVVSLPFYPDLTDAMVSQIVGVVHTSLKDVVGE